MAGRVYSAAPTYLETKIYHSIGLHFCIICLLGYIISLVPYQRLKLKVFWLYFLIYEMVGVAWFSWVQLTEDHMARAVAWGTGGSSGAFSISWFAGVAESAFIPVFAALVAYQVYRVLARFDFSKSTELNEYDIFLVITYPKSFIGLLLCVCTLVKGNSLSLISGGFWYKFNKRFGVLMATKWDGQRTMSGRYFIINTGIKTCQKRKEIRGIVGTKWGIGRNCLTEYQKVIGSLRQYL